ncbi:putative NADH2 dehydrogenase 40K chain [Violaceomyces palustris]|uniref:NADH2 dehydrogenase 40K chain n=1 Tax=Violaceomyces palustris TaxID=1673888 RepID=A0ACD0P3D8_9BASI|nr:putative NADH2 dehydrogenase 40K chain [Violaceomyces palustris]
MSLLQVSASLRVTARQQFPSAQQMPASRHFHDLVIKRKTGKPIIKSGPYGGGRSSVSGHVATVFGCTGFLGRYLVNRLAQKGTQVIVPYRDEDEKRHLKVMGDLGQIVPMEWDLRHDDQIEECVRHSDIVYNLTGRHYETKNFKFNDVHVEGARRIAQISESAGVSRLVHVSHLNADANSPSAFLRSKAEGEDAVKKSFEGATIVRPGTMYGHEDRFLNQMAVYPFSWRLNHGQTKMRPVHSLDVAHALETMLDAENTSIGATFSLAGPREYTVAQLLALVESLTFTSVAKPGFNTPKWALMAATRIADLAWWPMISPDEVTRRLIDDLPDAPGTKSWADLGIEPDLLEEVAIVYLRRYRPNTRFEQPVQSGGFRLKKQKYNVVD